MNRLCAGRKLLFDECFWKGGGGGEGRGMDVKEKQQSVSWSVCFCNIGQHKVETQ